MRKTIPIFAQSGIFTSIFAGTISFILGFAALDHWVYGRTYAHSIEKGIALLPMLLIFTVLVGFLAEIMSLFYGLAFIQLAKPWFINYLRVLTGMLGGFFTGLTVGTIAIFLQQFLTRLHSLVLLWR
jgi:hypothetical protein